MADGVAVLVTSHNRVSNTLRCLDAVAAQRGLDRTPDVVLVDAGSTDGTPEAVTSRYPSATVIGAGADVFWNGGMRLAFEHARSRGYGHYLWVNDDTVLDPDAVAVLLETERQLAAGESWPAIVVGSTRDPDTGELTYGGVHRTQRWRPLHFELVSPGPEPRECETMNGNTVLVPASVTERIGVLDERFTHGMGDYDYGLRARKAGCSIWIAPGTLGTCARNERQTDSSAGAAIRRLRGPKGLPLREWATFARRWAGPLWPLYAVSPYIRRVGAAALPR